MYTKQEDAAILCDTIYTAIVRVEFAADDVMALVVARLPDSGMSTTGQAKLIELIGLLRKEMED
jgi:hypothetical protein